MVVHPLSWIGWAKTRPACQSVVPFSVQPARLKQKKCELQAFAGCADAGAYQQRLRMRLVRWRDHGRLVASVPVCTACKSDRNVPTLYCLAPEMAAQPPLSCICKHLRKAICGHSGIRTRSSSPTLPRYPCPSYSDDIFYHDSGGAQVKVVAGS